MNFPLDQLFTSAYRDHPFKNIAWAHWVSKGEPGEYIKYLKQSGGNHDGSGCFERDKYTEKELLPMFGRNLEAFRFPSNYQLDKQIRSLFKIWLWLAEYIKVHVPTERLDEFQEFVQPDTEEYTRPLAMVSDNLHASFPETLQAAAKPMRTVEQVEEAYFAICFGDMRVPGLQESSIATEHRKYHPQIVQKLVKAQDGSTYNGSCLVPHLVDQIHNAVMWFYNEGAHLTGLHRTFVEQFGSAQKATKGGEFHIMHFAWQNDLVDRLKRTSGEEPSEVSAAKYSSLFFTSDILPLANGHEVEKRALTKLFMLSGYKYEKFMLDAVEAFGGACSTLTTPRNIMTFENVVDRYTDRQETDLFRFGSFDQTPIQLSCLKYLVQRAHALAGSSGPTAAQWKFVNPAPALDRDVAEAVRKAKKAVEDAPNTGMLWIVGGVCLGAYALLAR